MFIKSAWATAAETATDAAVTTAGALPAAPSAGETFALNLALVLMLVGLFYFLLIRPQQKRFKEHANMLSKLDKGVKIVTQGGMVGVIDKEISEHEVQIDVGNGTKINIMRSAIMGRYEDALPKSKPANDDKKVKPQDKAAK